MALYRREDHYDDDAIGTIAARYRDILTSVGEDPEREGLLKTPERAAKALAFLTQGIDQDAAGILKTAFF